MDSKRSTSNPVKAMVATMAVDFSRQSSCIPGIPGGFVHLHGVSRYPRTDQGPRRAQLLLGGPCHQVWLGTSDDWIGDSDRPTKETGFLCQQLVDRSQVDESVVVS